MHISLHSNSRCKNRLVSRKNTQLQFSLLSLFLAFVYRQYPTAYHTPLLDSISSLQHENWWVLECCRAELETKEQEVVALLAKVQEAEVGMLAGSKSQTLDRVMNLFISTWIFEAPYVKLHVLSEQMWYTHHVPSNIVKPQLMGWMRLVVEFSRFKIVSRIQMSKGQLSKTIFLDQATCFTLIFKLYEIR